MTVVAIFNAGPVDLEVSGSARRRRNRRRILLIVLIAAVVALLAGYAMLPWEWSFIDDGTAVQRLAAAKARYGPVLGIADAIYGTYRFDLGWGLFRPSYWVFGGTFYALGVRAAHAVRLAMLIAAVVGPAVVVARRTTGRRRVAMIGLMVFAVLVNPAMYSGLWYPSLQELSALSFIGLGMLPARRQWVRIALFVVAAWFKAPFAWLLVAYGMLLWIRRESRRAAVTSTLLGVATILAAGAFGTHGMYAGNMKLTPTQIGKNIVTVPGILGPALVVLVAGLLVYGARVRSAWPPGTATPDGWGIDGALPLASLVAGVAYLVNMLPWDLGVGGYYSAAWVYLLTVGIVLIMLDGPEPGPLLLAASLVVGAVWLGIVDRPVIKQGIATAANVNELRDCVVRLPDGSAIGYNRGEAWIRLEQIVLTHDPNWRSKMYLVFPGAGDGWRFNQTHALNYYIEQHGYPTGAAKLRGSVVCQTTQSTVYQVPTG